MHEQRQPSVLARVRSLPWTLSRLVLVLALLPFLVDIPLSETLRATDLLDVGAAPGARIVRIAGTETAIAESGRRGDPVLLLVHGFGGSTFGWRKVMEPLATDGYHIIALDLRGFGLSEKSWDADFSHEAQARFVLAAMDELDIARATLVGHSMGGNVVAWVAALAPERVDRLVFVDAAIVSPSTDVRRDPSFVQTALAVPQLRRVGRIAIRSAFDERAFGTLLGSAFAVKDAATPETVAGYAASTKLLDWDRALLGIVRDQPRNALPASISTIVANNGAPIRTLIVWGAEDSWVPIEAGTALRASIPGAEYAVLAGVGHVPFEEDAATFIERLEDWLAR